MASLEGVISGLSYLLVKPLLTLRRASYVPLIQAIQVHVRLRQQSTSYAQDDGLLPGAIWGVGVTDGRPQPRGGAACDLALVADVGLALRRRVNGRNAVADAEGALSCDIKEVPS